MTEALPGGKYSIVLNDATESALHTLMYFDIFRHPLTLDEINRLNHWKKTSISETAIAVESLCNAGIVNNHKGYYFLSGSESSVHLRDDRNQRALRYSAKAEKWSRFISGFPFVRTVCISGSLSKGTMDKNGDVDYFIITEPGRLWIARTFLIAFKKLFLMNSRKYFCVNYFIDTDNLNIPDRNIFSATEIIFVKPVCDSDHFRKFISENKWTEIFYPNSHNPNQALHRSANGLIKKSAEYLLRGRFGEWLDTQFLKITLSRWRNKFPDRKPEEFEVDFRSRKSVSKHHPQGFQRFVLRHLEERRTLLRDNFGIDIKPRIMEWTAGE